MFGLSSKKPKDSTDSSTFVTQLKNLYDHTALLVQVVKERFGKLLTASSFSNTPTKGTINFRSL